jgi:hypothetical protein
LTARRRTGFVLGSLFAAPLFLGLITVAAVRVSTLRFLLIFDLPGMVVGFAANAALPRAVPGGGEWFPGLGRMVLIAAACDWLFYAFLFYAIASRWTHSRLRVKQTAELPGLNKATETTQREDRG